MTLDPHEASNRALLAEVRPPDWTPPRPAPRYDLVVVGGGTAGLVSAAGAAGLGARVALIERAMLGGDCLNTGCVPSKALLASAHAAADARRAESLGIRARVDQVDGAAIMARVRDVRARVAPHDSARRLASLGVHVFFGSATFTAPARVEVGDARLAFSRAVIATGARPSTLPIEGLSDPRVLTSESFFEQADLPRRLAIVGGGPVGCEIAQACARLGSTVTLLEAAPRLLPREDPDAAGALRDALAADGVAVLTGTTAHHVEPRPDTLRVTLTRGTVAQTLDVDRLLIATGRRASTDGLGLEAAGVTVDAAGRVVVNDYLQTANRRIYAAGDACLPWQFTHAADASARLVIRNALFAGRARASRLLIPRTIYTDPEVAAIGLSHVGEADEAGVRARAFDVRFDDVDRAMADGRTRGFARIVVRAGSDGIAGATIVCARAGELISAISVAMSAGLGLSGLAAVIHPYPGYADALRRAADAYNRTRLTPRVASLMRTWLDARRRF